MTKRIVHGVIGLFAMIACVLLTAFLPPLWQGVSGRDFRPTATAGAALIFLVAAILRAGFRWPIADFLLSAFFAVVVTLCAIAHFTGFTWLDLFDRFSLSWLGTVSIFTTAPWVVGLLFGSALLKIRKHPHGKKA
jgi:hypothetical protein